MAGKGHGQEAVHAPIGIDGHGQGIDGAAPGKAVQEEIAQRTLHRGRFLTVPVHTQHQIPQDKAAFGRGVRYGTPDVLNRAAAGQLRQRDRLARGDAGNAGRTLAAFAQSTAGLTGRALGPGTVFPVDGYGTARFQQGQTAHQRSPHRLCASFLKE